MSETIEHRLSQLEHTVAQLSAGNVRTDEKVQGLKEQAKHQHREVTEVLSEIKRAVEPLKFLQGSTEEISADFYYLRYLRLSALDLKNGFRRAALTLVVGAAGIAIWSGIEALIGR